MSGCIAKAGFNRNQTRMSKLWLLLGTAAEGWHSQANTWQVWMLLLQEIHLSGFQDNGRAAVSGSGPSHCQETLPTFPRCIPLKNKLAGAQKLADGLKRQVEYLNRQSQTNSPL